MRHLDPNKAQGHYMLGRQMTKLCRKSFWEPVILIVLSVTFDDCLTGNVWKVIDISLQPIYCKILGFFTENNLTSPNQSGFRPGDSCINYLLLLKT